MLTTQCQFTIMAMMTMMTVNNSGVICDQADNVSSNKCRLRRVLKILNVNDVLIISGSMLYVCGPRLSKDR